MPHECPTVPSETGRLLRPEPGLHVPMHHVTVWPRTQGQGRGQMGGVEPTDDITSRFGRRVRQLRRARGWSQEALADRCGLDRTYISGIERGRRNVSLRDIEVIAQALGVSVSELTNYL